MMQGLVTIDFGNSHPHAGLFQKVANEWTLMKVCPWDELSANLVELNIEPKNSSLVLAEVKPREEELAVLQHQGFLVTRVKDYWRGGRFAGMPVNYAKTLGEDRLIQAFYCYKKLKPKVLLIDAGTFLTMDVITAKGFEGGYIIPGARHYFETFAGGEQLRDVPLDDQVTLDLPHATADAMRDSYSAFAALAEKLISQHSIEKVILSGGQSSFWQNIFNQLNLPVTVQEEPALIHLALQHWMTTQIEPL